MKHFFITAAALAMSFAASAQHYYQDANNPDIYRHSAVKSSNRAELVVPGIRGYNVYKADFHIHTVYSDAEFTPDMRVREAWRDGLDIIAITDHVEYRRIEGKMMTFLKGYMPKDAKTINTNIIGGGRDKNFGIIADLNYSVKEAKSVAGKYGITVISGAEITREPVAYGHYNALFTTDNNAIYDDDPAQSMRNAIAQGALILHNHPGWSRKSADYTEFEKKVYAEGLISGVETNNGSEFYPKIITRAQEQKLFVSSNTDIHTSTYDAYALQGQMRNMTLVFAKDCTEESVKEALLDRRTLALSFGTLAGDKGMLEEFFNASVSFKVIYVSSKGAPTVLMTNNTSIPYIIRMPGKNPIVLAPFTSFRTGVNKDKSLKFTVDNMWYGENERLEIEKKF